MKFPLKEESLEIGTFDDTTVPIKNNILGIGNGIETIELSFD
jgi:hypothetical protein